MVMGEFCFKHVVLVLRIISHIVSYSLFIAVAPAFVNITGYENMVHNGESLTLTCISGMESSYRLINSTLSLFLLLLYERMMPTDIANNSVYSLLKGSMAIVLAYVCACDLCS